MLDACRTILLTLVQKVDELKLLCGPITADINNRNQNRDVVQANKYNKLEFLPINDTDLLKEFDQNLAKRDPENVELQTQFVIQIYIIF